jgi:hypothetical protein
MDTQGTDESRDAARQGDGIVAFIDISGFISVIEAEVSSVALWEEMRLMRQGAAALYNPSSAGDAKGGLIFVGDAFLLYAFDPTDDGIASFVRSVSNICGLMMLRGWRIRAGITMGDLLVSEDRTHYLGLAVARAHKLESNQQWFGGAFGAEFNDWFQSTTTGQELVAQGYVEKYEVPLKDGAVSGDFALGWPRGLPLDEIQLRRNLTQVYPELAAADKITNRLDQTVEFYRHRDARSRANRKSSTANA